jgi:antitoxin component HigA of HigAB toxin-antitoxin module
MDAKRNTPRGDRLDVLVTLVEAWETKHFRSICRMPWKPSNITWISKALRRAT